MKAKEFIIELKKPSKPPNFVAKNASLAGKAGQHKNKKRATQQGDVKHKRDLMPMESQGVAEGEDSKEIGPGWKTEHGIVDRVDGNSVIVKTSQGKMRVNITDIKTAEAPEQGMAEGTDDLRSAVLSVLQNIYNGARAGEEMIDAVADELGDYFQDVKRSKDKALRQAYQFMRQEGAEAEGNPGMMAQVAKQAIDVLSQQGVAEGLEGKVVFSGTGANGGKYEIIRHGDDFMIRANGKHIDSYGSLQRAIGVLKNEVPGLKQGVAEGPNDGSEDNFTIDDIKRLEKIQDFETLKAQAKQLIKGKPARRMKPEKISFFYNRVDTLRNPLAVIKMMYDMMLAGEGNRVIGSRNSMSSNSYRQRFGEQGVAEVSLGNYREKALKQKAQSQMGAMFNKDSEKQKQDLATFNKRERGLNRLKARDEVARKSTADKQMADNIAKLPELKAEYERMKAEYKSLGGSNWQYADREQNLTDRERKARSMEGPMNNLWRTISAAEKAQKSQGVGEGWKDKVAAAGLAGAMAFGAAGANARVTPGDDPSINRLTGKQIATQQATDNAPAKAEAPKGFSKEYLQAVVDGKHPRPMVSVEKAKELLKNMSESSKISFAGTKVGHKEGPAGQWRNDGAKKNKPAKPGDLVGGGM